MTLNTAPFDLHRIRLTYARREPLRYISHLDMQLVWERTLRRAGLPLAYSQGFNPNPRMHMAAALPLGFLSRGEIIDFWLETPPGAAQPNPNDLAARIRAAAPPGLEISQAEIIPLQAPALQTQVLAAEYTAAPLDALEPQALAQAIEELLGKDTLPRERRGKIYDLRPLIYKLELSQPESARPVIAMSLAAREGATGRPDEVLAAMGLEPADFRIERISLILQPPAGA